MHLALFVIFDELLPGYYYDVNSDCADGRLLSYKTKKPAHQHRPSTLLPLIMRMEKTVHYLILQHEIACFAFNSGTSFILHQIKINARFL